MVKITAVKHTLMNKKKTKKKFLSKLNYDRLKKNKTVISLMWLSLVFA